LEGGKREVQFFRRISIHRLVPFDRQRSNWAW